MVSSIYNLPVEQASNKKLFLDKKVREAVPSFVYEEKTQFINFLNAYFEYVDQSGLPLNDLKALREVRDANLSAFKGEMKKEFAKNQQSIGTIDDATLLKIMKIAYLSKGNEESILGFFRLFLGDDTVSVSYPKDNMLIVDGGNYDTITSRYIGSKNLIDEITVFLQDDYYYQIYSYVIKTGFSKDKWGENFNKSIHPLGWIFFGEIQIVEEGFFRVGLKSPLLIPGSQEVDAPDIVLTDTAIHTELGHMQLMKLILPSSANYFVYDSNDLGLNIIASQGITVGDLQDFTIEQLTSETSTSIPIGTNMRRGTQIGITT